MHSQLKKILSLMFALVSMCCVAQNNTISPYSKYGIGLFEPNGLGRSLAMGGVGIALESGQNVNNINPASYASLDSTMVLFDIGLQLDYEYIKTHLESGGKINGNISYFSLSLSPNNRLGLSFGIAPYSSVGYTISTNEYMTGGGQMKYLSQISGLGGLTRVYLGTGYRLFKNISLGVNASVLFGPKSECQTIMLPETNEFSINVDNSDYYVGGKLDFGFQQNIEISKKNILTIGAIYSTPGILRCDRTEFACNSFTYVGIVDTLYYDNDDADRYTTLPATFGVGVSYSKNKRIVLSADFNYNPLSKFKLYDKRSKMLDNSMFNIGMEYVPKRLGRNKNLDWVFRCGGGYETGAYKIDDYKLNSFNISAGVGFRIRSIKFNTYCMYKQHGTRNNLLVLDQKIRFGLNLTYVDYWFQKYRYN